MENRFKSCAWRGLIGFCLVYNIVYLGRFNVNYLIDEISKNMTITDGQERILMASVFASYALGSFINGPIADRIGAKKIILIGGLTSALMNVIVYYSYSWSKLLVIWFINGYFQSMIWIGGVVLVANWWRNAELGMSIGIANFASGLSHVTAYLLPIGLVSIWPGLDWKMNFVIPMGILVLFLMIFELIAVESPESKKLESFTYENKKEQEKELLLKERLKRKENPWGIILKRRGFIVWCFIAALSSICRYGLLNWIPLYYEGKPEGDILLSESFANLTLPMGMAFGTLVITWIAGVKFRKNMGLVIATLAATCATLVVIFPMLHNSQAIFIGIFMTGFVLYGINGILWLYAIEKGKRVLSGTAAGILNSFAYVGAGLESVLFPGAIKLFPNTMIVFVMIELFCITMVICAIIVSRKDTNVVKG